MRNDAPQGAHPQGGDEGWDGAEPEVAVASTTGAGRLSRSGRNFPGARSDQSKSPAPAKTTGPRNESQQKGYTVTTIQVLPHEVRQGDRITINAKVEFTGQPFDLNGRRVIALYYDTDASVAQSHYVDPDQPLTVDRPDPDADLIEAMHEAYMCEFAARGYQLVEAATGDRCAAFRAALAALREYEAGA